MLLSSFRVSLATRVASCKLSHPELMKIESVSPYTTCTHARVYVCVCDRQAGEQAERVDGGQDERVKRLSGCRMSG